MLFLYKVTFVKKNVRDAMVTVSFAADSTSGAVKFVHCYIVKTMLLIG